MHERRVHRTGRGTIVAVALLFAVMTLGMADLTTGIYAATRIPHERRRQERWERARKDGVTRVELAHFEGELQSSSETRNGERLLVRWNGLTHAIAGVSRY